MVVRARALVGWMVLVLACAVGSWACGGATATSPSGSTAPQASGTRPAGPATQPAPGEFVPFTFIHAGDTELGSPDLEGTARRFGLLARRANALDVAAVIIAGDLFHDPGHADQQQAFDEVLKLFRMDVRAVPGNHDHPDMDVFRKRFGRENSVFTLHNCDFVCLDSNDLSAKALAWLEEVLAGAEGARRTHTFVVMHHPPAEGGAADKVLRRHHVSGVLCGHLHTTGQADRPGYRVYWVSGTAKVRDANGLRYNLFRVQADRVEQESRLVEKEVP